jgi:malonyl CoA-acyl carrier protein transacylase
MRNIDEMTEYLSLHDSETSSFRSLDRLPICAPNNEIAVEVALQLLDRFQIDMTLEEYNTQIETVWRSARGPSRWILSAHNPTEMRQSLEDFIYENRASATDNRHSESRKVVFVFSGMGPQWSGMGRELATNLPRFTQYIKYIDHELAKFYGWSVWNELNQRSDVIQLPTALAQASNFLIQAALYHLLSDENIKPEAIVGHSTGEIAAAYAAGIYTLEEAAQIVVTLGRLQASLSNRGSMLAVGLSHEDTIEAIKPYSDISIAAVNDGNTCTVSGDSKQIDHLEKHLKEDEVFSKKLCVEVPFHSPVMDEITDAITSELAFLEPKPAKTTLYSTVSGKESDFYQWTSEYWAKNIRQPVLFADAINCVLESNKNCFIEISPHPVLSQSLLSLTENLTDISIHHLLSRHNSEYDTFSNTLCDLAKNSVGRPKQISSAPLAKPVRTVQPLQDDDQGATSTRQGKLAFDEIPILCQPVPDTADHYVVELSLEEHPWIEGNTVQGLGPIVPATMWAELFSLALARDGIPKACLHNLNIVQALPVSSNPNIVSIEINGTTAMCYSRPSGETENRTLHATTSIAPPPVPFDYSSEKVSYNPDTKGIKLNPNTVYNAFRLKGLNYSGHFKNLTEITVGRDQEAWATISGKEKFESGLHSPWVLDAGLQLLIVAAKDWGEVMYLPFRIGKVSLYHAITDNTDYLAHAEVDVVTEAELKGNVKFFDQHGKLLAELKGITCIHNLSDDIESNNYFDKFTYALSNFTPKEITEHNTVADD